MSAPQIFVGMEVATAPRDIALRPTGARWTVRNDATGRAARVVQLQALQPTLIGLEATGGYHRAVGAALAAAAWPLVVVNPRQGRAFAQATGPWANTAPLEARAVAHCAEAVRPVPPLSQTPSRKSGGPVCARRRQRIGRRTAEQNRLENAPPRLRADITAPIAWLEPRVAALDNDLDTTLRARPVWRERESL